MDLTRFGIKGNPVNNDDEIKVEKKNLPISEKLDSSSDSKFEISEVEDSNLEIDFEKIRKDYFSPETEKFLPWFLKYQLKDYSDLIITSEIKKIINFLEKRPKDKGILLYGQPGSGKTTTTNLVANHFGYEIFELNASDARNKKSIEQSVGDVIKQKSLFAKNKLILIDEVDGVSGTQDRGGVAELVKIIKESPYPIFFTANDIESDKIKSILKQCILVDFENNSLELLIGIGKKILNAENVKYDEKDLVDFINDRNTTDIRGFINDLQAEVFNLEFKNTGDLEIRNYKKKIEELLNKIYYSYPEDSLFSSFNTDINIDELFLYLEENTPLVYDKKALHNALNELGKADVFRGRIRKWQYWRYLVYINFYLTYGVSEVKENPKRAPYKRNSRILKKWIYNNKVLGLNWRTKIQREKNEPESFIEKLSKYYKRSVKRIRSDDIFYFAKTYQNDVDFRTQMNTKLAIDEKTQKMLMEL